MAPPRLYDRPVEQLRALLQQAKRRGLTFDEAWEEAVRPGRPLIMSTSKNVPAGAIKWPTDRTDRVEQQKVIAATREGWRRAYDDMPMNEGERALMVLGEAFSRLDEMALRHAIADGRGMGGGSRVASAA